MLPEKVEPDCIVIDCPDGTTIPPSALIDPLTTVLPVAESTVNLSVPSEVSTVKSPLVVIAPVALAMVTFVTSALLSIVFNFISPCASISPDASIEVNLPVDGVLAPIAVLSIFPPLTVISSILGTRW